MKDRTPEDLEALRVLKERIEAEYGPAPGRSGGPLQYYIDSLTFGHLGVRAVRVVQGGQMTEDTTEQLKALLDILRLLTALEDLGVTIPKSIEDAIEVETLKLLARSEFENIVEEL